MEYQIKGANIDKITWSESFGGTLCVYFYDGKIIEYKHVPEGIAAGIVSAVSAGSYINRYVRNNYSYEVIQQLKTTIDEEEFNKLQHHKASTIGLWATDKPEIIPEDIKHLFFQIDY